MTDAWHSERLDLDGYLARVGLARAVPSRAGLDALHQAHVRTFAFDNIDVLLDQHPGVDLDVVAEKFLDRGRGGYCFEHTTLFAAALELLGYDVRRHLGRVGDPAAGTLQGRTHMSVEVLLDGERLLCDPGFGMSLLLPIPLVDGTESDQRGWRYRIERSAAGWGLHRLREGGWELTHTTDELPVLPIDVAIGHHWTSTFPGSHFRAGLMLARHFEGHHVALTGTTVTVRRPGEPTEHRPLRDGELAHWLDVFGVPDPERGMLLERFA